MSTKTTFKRIALATVATLGFGLLSVVPSQAAGMLADSLLNATDGSTTVATAGTVNSAAKAKIVWSGIATGAGDTATVTGTITSVPATASNYLTTFAATTGFTVDPNVNAGSAVNSGIITTGGTGGRVTKYITASFTPDVAGTYVIALKSTGGVNNSTVVWTITVAAIPVPTAAASTIDYKSEANSDPLGYLCYFVYNCFANNPDPLLSLDSATAQWATEGESTANADGTYSAAVTPATAGTVIGSGLVYISNKTVIAGNTIVATPLTVSISGHGYVRVDGPGGPSAIASTITETNGAGYTPYGGFDQRKAFWVYSDGTSGPATVTVSSNGVVLGTVDLIMTGAKASLALATGSTTKLSKKYVGSSETATVTINGLDAAGNVLASSGITTVTSSDATGTIASAVIDSIDGNKVIITGGPVSGTVTWTVTDGTRKVTFVTNTTKKTGSFVLSFDAASYGPGEKVTWKVVGTDSNGSPVADGPRAAFGSVESNLAVLTLGVGSLPGTSLSFVDGVATGYFYAPSTASATLNLSTTIGAANATFATAGAADKAAKTVTSFAISNGPVDAATAAAEEAIAAANDATDAALSAAEAAEAATALAQEAVDAVAELSAMVTQLISALRAQITSLTNLIIKIQKKLKA